MREYVCVCVKYAPYGTAVSVSMNWQNIYKYVARNVKTWRERTKKMDFVFLDGARLSERITKSKNKKKMCLREIQIEYENYDLSAAEHT